MEKLPSETELLREQGVRRTMVREAISYLQASGLVETSHGISTSALVRPTFSGLHPSIRVRAIIKLLMGLEARAAVVAAERRSEEQLFTMMQAMDVFKVALSAGESNAEHRVRFHMSIAESADNRLFPDMMQHTGIKLIPRTCFSMQGREATDFTPLEQLAYIKPSSI